ncbi:MAG: TetR/AcrR family transcriptional regulator [Thermotogae bacterium]|nr:TetR/AcrR family transcriptional regulator [Thermotogota bacterium]MCP5465677.1 TetR/AcrR family transcriptional regulator [Thermotogota bacterium]
MKNKNLKNEELKKVLEATLIIFQEKGLNFTMDDLSAEIGISKRTLYEIIRSKEEIINIIVKEARKSIKQRQKEIISDNSLDTVEKIKEILTITPDLNFIIRYRHLSQIQKIYPKVYDNILKMFNEEWEPTYKLFEQAINENKIKPFNIALFKEMYLSVLTTISRKKYIMNENVTYSQIFQETIDILLNGIINRGK